MCLTPSCLHHHYLCTVKNPWDVPVLRSLIQTNLPMKTFCNLSGDCVVDTVIDVTRRVSACPMNFKL